MAGGEMNDSIIQYMYGMMVWKCYNNEGNGELKAWDNASTLILMKIDI
jgi:hypothetical protein